MTGFAGEDYLRLLQEKRFKLGCRLSIEALDVEESSHLSTVLTCVWCGIENPWCCFITTDVLEDIIVLLYIQNVICCSDACQGGE